MERAHSETALTRGSTSFTDRLVHAHSSDAVLAHKHKQRPRDDGSSAEDASAEDADTRDERQHDDNNELAATSARSSASIKATTTTTEEQLHVDEQTSVWSRPEHKLTAFALLLLDEFLGVHALSNAARALKDELVAHQLGVPVRTAELWCELHHSCRAALAHKSVGSSNSNRTSSTLEKLLAFCVGSSSNSVSGSVSRRGFALDLLATSPASVCASPKTSTKRSSSSSSAFSLMDAHVQMTRSPVVRPSLRASAATSAAKSEASPEATGRLASSASAPVLAVAPPILSASVSDAANRTTNAQTASSKKSTALSSSTTKQAKMKCRHGAPMPQRPHQHHPESLYHHSTDKPHSSSHFGSNSQPSVDAHDAQRKHERATVRLLERELRHIRLEKLAFPPPTRALVKRLGFASMTKRESQELRERHDPYVTDLVLERLGLNKRADCALCQASYLQVNLPHKVSFKCILDVYASWQYEPPDRATAVKYRPPLCYDAVHVCRMCAQIVLGHTAAAEASRPPRLAAAQQPRQSSSQQRVRTSTSNSDDERFCSDPYALPPLFADDCYDERSASQRYDNHAHDELLYHRGGQHTESPAKAIVYANQSQDVYMTPKEWEVIKPERSRIRAAVESTVPKSGSNDG